MRARESTAISVASLARRRTWRLALEGGLAHASEMTPADPRPGQPVTLAISTNASAQIDLVAVCYTTDGTEPVSALGVAENGTAVLAERGEATLDLRTGLRVRPWSATIPGQADGVLVRYRVEGWSVRGQRRRWLAGATAERPEGEVFTYAVDEARAPSWFDDAVLYAVVVDRFAGAGGERLEGVLPSGFAGGTIPGLLARLDTLRDLGITCLWLLPVTASDSFDGLLPTSYFTVAERYGGNAALRSLVGEAHERGMRVVLSVPLFQVASEHPLYRRARAHPTHPVAAWFEPDAPGAPPTLDTDHPDVRRYLLDVATFWLGDMGLDGLHFPEADLPSLTFWTEFQLALKAAFPHALTLGSVACSASEAGAYAGRLDAVLDCPLALALRRVFATREVPLRALLTGLDPRALPPLAAPRVTYLDFLDLDRFSWLAEGSHDRLALAATCQLTLEGTPALFYGTEVGLTQELDDRGHPDGEPGRLHVAACPPMPWPAPGQRDLPDQSALFAHLQRLLALRNGHPALRDGRRLPLPTQVLAGPADAAEHVGAYARWTDTEYLVVVLNNAEAPVTVRLPLAAALRPLGVHVDDSIPFNRHLLLAPTPPIHLSAGVLDVTLPPLGAMVLGQG